MLIIGAVLLISWAALIFLRIPSSIAFLSLLIGQLLATEATDELYNFVAGVTNAPDTQFVQLALLLLPLILTILFMRNRVSKSKIGIEALPLLFVASLTILLIAPLLPALQSLLDIATNDQLSAYKSIVIIAASVSGLLSAWLSYPKAPKPDKKHHS